MTGDEYLLELESILGIKKQHSAQGRAVHAAQLMCYGKPAITIISAEGSPHCRTVWWDHYSQRVRMETSNRMRGATLAKLGGLVQRFLDSDGFLDAVRRNGEGQCPAQ